jgi:hypothetical protein
MAMTERAEVLEERTLWPLILTQRMIVARKRADEPAATEQGPR